MKKLSILLLAVIYSVSISFCQSSKKNKQIYLGADLSYTNEMEDCGGKYQSKGIEVDPFKIFKENGANIIRLRLWHSPDWTKYSNLTDVKKSISRAKKLKMNVLLDFHYSDTWTDPQHQTIPKAWANIKDTNLLGDSLYNYTLKTLLELSKENLLPDFVQVGNETNAEILQYTPDAKQDIDWKRNIALFNRGIEAVKKVNQLTGKKIGTMVHIAQPENAIAWFTEATKNKIIAFDWIGLSYYPKWSKYDLTQLSSTIISLRNKFNKRVMIVETGFPYTLKNTDQNDNLLNEGTKKHVVSPEGQKQFMIDLTKTVLKAGGEGVVYWEPNWISTPCKTLWATGSSWENATFFDASNHNEVLPVFQFFDLTNYK